MDVIKQAKMAQILGPEGGGVLTPQEKRRTLQGQNSRGSRRGSRESLDSCQYDAGDEVRFNIIVVRKLLFMLFVGSVYFPL